MTTHSGAAAVGAVLPPWTTNEAISDDKELRDRVVAFSHRPPNRHTAKMCKEKGGAATAALLAGMWHSNARVRASSARLLRKLEPAQAQAAPVFNKVLTMDPSPDVRAAAASVLVDLKIAACGPALVEVLRKDKDERARANAAWALGKLRFAKAVPALRAALLDDATWTRIRAATALGRVRARSAKRDLEKALTDPNGEVRKSAARALKKITGRSYRPRGPRAAVK